MSTILHIVIADFRCLVDEKVMYNFWKLIEMDKKAPCGISEIPLLLKSKFYVAYLHSC